MLDAVLSPLEIDTLPQRDLSRTHCVVFDVLRATSSMVVALSHGAQHILPVREISEALDLKRRQPEVLLAGERNGILIGKELTGSLIFDLGNSPREFTHAKIAGKTIVMTTTNGTRALCACSHAAQVFLGSFLNLTATVDRVCQENLTSLLLVCAGTEQDTAYEDILCAGAFIDLLVLRNSKHLLSDSALIARAAYLNEQTDLVAAFSKSRNAQRLLSIPLLREDVVFCAQRDAFPRVVKWKAGAGESSMS